jgi:hypothetical protein
VGRTTNKQRRDEQAATARSKAAAARAEQKRREQRRRALTILGSVVGVAALVIVIAIIAITHSSSKSDPSGDRVAATPAVVQDVTSVSDATLKAVGAGSVITVPKPVSGEPPLTSGGKPELLYIGAEFCPYCAVERWSLAIALSKFGTVGKLGMVRAATADGNYASLDFLNSTYTSKYLTFTSVENQDRNHKTLQTLTSAQNTLWNKLTNNSPGFPTISFGNKVAFALTPPLDPAVLGSLTQAQIASQLNDPTSKVSKVVDGGANDDIAAICQMTGNQPATVCSAPLVATLQGQMHG